MFNTICMDMDGVIYDWITCCKNIFEKDCGVPLSWWEGIEGWGNPQWMDEGLEHWQYYREHEERFFTEGKPYQDAKRGMEEVFNLCEDLAIVTVGTQKMLDAKREWLERYSIVYDHVILIEMDGHHTSTQKKSEVPGDVFVDDAPHHIDDIIVNTGAPAVVFDQRWNRDSHAPKTEVMGSSRVYRARGWLGQGGLVEVLKTIGAQRSGRGMESAMVGGG